ncbi:hypothetical protein EVG20_g9227 [Dentipellis fragilis]|uniref:Major facilitator superfamily (MFS) profile domain-containing protein n=1 Tax=Dentipellis fragilis TaxID=205917 RepID=A0A4Y9XZK8_9AGAM|nr:hypothetical protein EVG20_g9227 [Dentipellis fragilis]
MANPRAALSLLPAFIHVFRHGASQRVPLPEHPRLLARVHRLLGHRPLRIRHVRLILRSLRSIGLTCPPVVPSGVAGGVVNSPYFQVEFGMRPASGPFNQHTIDNFSSNVVSVLQGGAFFGALGSAPMSAYIGRRWTLIVFTLIFTLGAILQTIAGGSRGLGYIYGGRVVSGVGIGGISAIAPAYVSECSPKNVRGRITGCFQIMVATGVMISYFINCASVSFDFVPKEDPPVLAMGRNVPTKVKATSLSSPKVAGLSGQSRGHRDGISLHIHNSPLIWRVPFGFQLVPAGIMAIGLLTVHESPRWLASVGRTEAAQRNLAIYRRLPVNDHAILAELAEIEAAIEEERIARADLGFKEAFLGKGNWIRFAIAFWIFFLQQWCGQNSVNYYTPQIFASIGYSSTTSSLLASGIYGIVKLIATTLFIFFLVETLGRKKSFFISAVGMGVLFFIVGALLKEFPPPAVPTGTPPVASKAMAAMIYIYVVFYSMGWGPLPWVYVSDIFPTRTRHYGLALASASQWLWNFVVSKVTPTIHTNLGYKMFLMFAAINIGAMATFSLLIPETKGRSLEEMDIIFGSVSREERQAHIERQERELDHEKNDTTSSQSHSVDQKVDV